MCYSSIIWVSFRELAHAVPSLGLSHGAWVRQGASSEHTQEAASSLSSLSLYHQYKHPPHPLSANLLVSATALGDTGIVRAVTARVACLPGSPHSPPTRMSEVHLHSLHTTH